MPKTFETKYNAPALDKGLDILEHLSKKGTPLSQMDIAEGIGRTPSEIYRMLVRLEERGYLIRTGNSGNYRLSLKMYNLSHRHTPFDELKRVAEYPMQTLASKTRQSCHLSILQNDRLMVILQMRSPEPISLSVEEGIHFPLSVTNSGKVFLAMLPRQKRTEVLSRDIYFTQWPSSKKKQFLQKVEKVAQDGHCAALSQLTSGVTDIAVPIGEIGSDFVSVLDVSILTANISKEVDLPKILIAAKEAQAEINTLIGI
ncbi:MAG: IclR family transcriptional regulator [Bacteroidota bacterium]